METGRKWMEAMREERYTSIASAAKAAGVSENLLNYIESGDVTGPGIAKRIGKAYGMTAKQVREITSEATVKRRKREAQKSAREIRRDRLEEVFQS